MHCRRLRSFESQSSRCCRPRRSIRCTSPDCRSSRRPARCTTSMHPRPGSRPRGRPSRRPHRTKGQHDPPARRQEHCDPVPHHATGPRRASRHRARSHRFGGRRWEAGAHRQKTHRVRRRCSGRTPRQRRGDTGGQARGQTARWKIACDLRVEGRPEHSTRSPVDRGTLRPAPRGPLLSLIERESGGTVVRHFVSGRSRARRSCAAWHTPPTPARASSHPNR